MFVREDILQNRGACIRAIYALKAGRAPKEGVEFLSVGAHDTIACIEKVLQRADRRAVKPLWLIGDYGEGKSHTLRLFASVAEREKFVWAYVTHDAREHIGLHKPARLFRRILWNIVWAYPDINLDKYCWELNRVPNYHDEYQFRSSLPSCLSSLGKSFREQRYRGVVVFVDEVEDCCNFWWNQHRPAYETLHSLVQNPDPYFLLCFGITRSGLQRLQSLWWLYIGEDAKKLLESATANAIPLPYYDDSYLAELAERISKVHSVAFDWNPTLSVEEIVERLKKRKAHHNHWRTVVQSIVTELEVAHQATHRYISKYTDSLHELVSPRLHLPSPSPPHPEVVSPKIEVGDLVEIIAGEFRGWKGTVRRVSSGMLEVEITLRNGMRMIQRLLTDRVKKLRAQSLLPDRVEKLRAQRLLPDRVKKLRR